VTSSDLPRSIETGDNNRQIFTKSEFKKNSYKVIICVYLHELDNEFSRTTIFNKRVGGSDW
jgi:hypothetical protein